MYTILAHRLTRICQQPLGKLEVKKRLGQLFLAQTRCLGIQVTTKGDSPFVQQ